MRKIVITGAAAVLALGLTACSGDGDGGASAAPPVSSPAPSGLSTPQNPSGSDAPQERPGGRQIASKWGQLRYLAPGRFLVSDVVFFTAADTVLQVAGNTCPDGTTPSGDGKCSIDGFYEWVQGAPHKATVQFSGQAATLIRETR